MNMRYDTFQRFTHNSFNKIEKGAVAACPTNIKKTKQQQQQRKNGVTACALHR